MKNPLQLQRTTSVNCFVPPMGEGMPEGAWEFGETTLRPACKSLLSKCPDCELPNER